MIENKPKGGKYLLIDDKASYGWENVLKHCINEYLAFDSYDKEIDSYEKLPHRLQDKIKQGYYDVIFLDLRLQSAEENKAISPESLSGMSVLKGIKDANPGNQVIILAHSAQTVPLVAVK